MILQIKTRLPSKYFEQIANHISIFHSRLRRPEYIMKQELSAELNVRNELLTIFY